MPSINPSDIPPHILAILERLVNAGHSAQVVGGAVRDILLDQKPKDFDVITSARPPQIKALFRRCFLVGKRFRLALVHSHHQVTEVATYRHHDAQEDDKAIEYEESGRMLSDNAYGTLDTDAHRRDFTINALYYDALENRLIDEVGGLVDIDNKLVRMIGSDTRQRLREDPLRAVRAVRIAKHNRIGIEAGLAGVLPEARPWLDAIPRARIGLELSKIFDSAQALSILEALAEYQLLEALVPARINDIFAENERGRALKKLLTSAHTCLYRDADALVNDHAIFPKSQGREICYTAFYLPLLLENCPDGIESFTGVLEAIAQSNPQILCPTVRAHRQGMMAIWRSLPRLFKLKSGQMRRFSEHRNFPATWFFYSEAVKSGVFEHDASTKAWEDFMSDKHGKAYLASIAAANARPPQKTSKPSSRRNPRSRRRSHHKKQA